MKRYNLYVKIGENYTQIPGQYEESDKQELLKVGYRAGITYKFVPFDEPVDSSNGSEPNTEPVRNSTIQG